MFQSPEARFRKPLKLLVCSPLFTGLRRLSRLYGKRLGDGFHAVWAAKLRMTAVLRILSIRRPA